MNRLGSATSPYLLQHADNPVDWWEWSSEAFAEAKRRDVPVLISVGYAACHWCHVMAHESFADEEVARLVNESLVSIKVDREERPDVDAIYMTATTALTGHGGWPMTVFATPDGNPFYCGTYYPRETFMRLVQAVANAWRTRRDDLVRDGARVVDAIGKVQGAAGFEPIPGAVSPSLADKAIQELSSHFDPVNAGFSDAPKFPPSMALLFLLRHFQRTGDPSAMEIARSTCEAMARGGLYDQLAGGFARYSVDERWLVPHFEKMLYDNALLLRVYTLLWRLTGDALAGRVASQTATFLVDALHVPGGGFASSLDADTDGVEGATYVWRPGQLVDVLGQEDGAWAADLFGVTETGTFEHGTSVLALRRDVDGADTSVQQRWQDVRDALYRVRAGRPQPGRDDKVVSAWNGLAITALAEYLMLAPDAKPDAQPDAKPDAQPDAKPDARPGARSDAKLRAALDETAHLLDQVQLVDGRLRRASRAGRVGVPAGVLEDYGCVAEGFCAMHQLTGDDRWLRRAGELIDTALAHFGDGEDSGRFHDTADDAEALFARPADITDNASPSGVSSIAAALVTYSALTGDSRYRARAERALEVIASLIVGEPRHAGYAAATVEALLSGPYEIAVSLPTSAAIPAGGAEGGSDGSDGSEGSEGVSEGAELVETARRLAPPGAVVVAGAPDTPGVPLLADRPLINGRATAYVCRGFVCERPVTEPDELAGVVGPLTELTAAEVEPVPGSARWSGGDRRGRPTGGGRRWRA